MNFRLLLRMTAPTITVSILLLGIGAGAALYVYRQQSETSQMLERHVEGLAAARELGVRIFAVRSSLHRYLMTSDRAPLEEVPAQTDAIERSLVRTAELSITPKGRERLAAVGEALRRFRVEFEEVLNEPTTLATRAAVQRLSEDRLTNEILEVTRLHLDDKYDAVAQFSEYNRQLTRWMVSGLLLPGFSGAGAGLLSGFSIARSVSRSMVQLTVPIRDAAGVLDEVVGPVTVLAGSSFEELQGVLEQLATRTAKMVEKLQESQQQALRSEQLAAVGQLAAGMAHELRNPLMAMKILVQSAAERGTSAGLSGRGLQILEEEILRLEQLISTFLEFARPPAMEHRQFDIREAIQATVKLVQPQAQQRDVHLASDLPGEPAVVHGDPQHLRQVLLNLLLNALDASSRGNTILVRLTLPGGFWRPNSDAAMVGDWQPECVSKTGWVMMEVLDQGCGLPDNLGSRIFEPFVSTKETGVGLGLSICQRIVTAHGGHIEAVPRTGGGTVFRVFLPLAAEPADASLATAAGGR